MIWETDSYVRETRELEERGPQAIQNLFLRKVKVTLVVVITSAVSWSIPHIKTSPPKHLIAAYLGPPLFPVSKRQPQFS
jgi:hypothetical protein